MLNYLRNLDFMLEGDISAPKLVVDCETTGLPEPCGECGKVVQPRLCQLALGWLDQHGQIDREWSEYCLPPMRMPPEAEAIHGITDKMLAGALPFESWADQLYGWLSAPGLVVVGWAVHFDVAVLRNEFALAGYNWEPQYVIDVKPHYEPGTHLADVYGAVTPSDSSGKNWHNAGVDMRATAEVYYRMKHATYPVAYEEVSNASQKR